MFRYATGTDKCCMIIGSLAALGAGIFLLFINLSIGAGLPLFSIFFGNVINYFLVNTFIKVADTFGPDSTSEDIYHSLKNIALKMIILAGGVGVLAYTMFSCWMLAGDR